ncbi:hypothetical protein BABA_10541 [Neobacillus bataviensis LMG 21833]|uniref:Uncharacterized protein n=1 Tax=Neobacillus bataviensis LMG 21833 TaxID=1117379 RepID=K6DLV3_9BACI|nr:hypothetical protein [Neobacillus bataviensis]EKN69294.1 hypothetical protein BABA_10541 [Neobacillus bataviensis LMG 21833]
MIGESAVVVPTNWKSNIDQVVAGYETEPAEGLVHGFQKDSIQNSWGARINKKGNGWGTRFQLIENEKGVFLCVEDWGTTGMTGPNIPMDEINNMSGDLDSEYRLARFSAMNYSGGNEGAGLFGRGKLLYSAASNDYNFIFETLTKKEGYRANYKMLEGNSLKVANIAYENEVARQYIKDNTELTPINKVGSRIIILNPRVEIVNAIKNGYFLNYIEETWWRIILKYHVTICVEYNGEVKTAKVPSVYNDAIEEKNGWKAWKRNAYTLPAYHSVKKIELFVSEEEINEELCGVAFYRRDMKIGEIPLDIPAKIKNKYFGFIEVDNNWEAELALNEDLEHYGVKNKNKRCFQKLKFEVNNEHKIFMEDLGLIKKKTSEDQRLRQELTEISQGLDTFFNTINVESIGSRGQKKEKIEVSWAGIDFPNSNRDRLLTGDKIRNIKFKIKNNTGSTKKIEYKLSVTCKNQEVKNIATSIKEIQGSSEENFGPFELIIDSPLVRYEKNIIALEVSIAGKTIIKQIPFYYDTTPVSEPRHNFLLKNTSMKFPREESKRVNTNESLTEIKYTIENNTAEKAFIAFHLSTHNVAQSNELIESIILKKDIVLNPYDKMEIDCPDIMFHQDVYESKIDQGKIEIRARISAAQDFLDYEMAEELSKGSKISVFFNQDPNGSGSTFSDFRTFTEESGKKSDLNNVDGNWVFDLYVKHPAYERIVDDEEHRKEYLAEEMLKQMVRAHIEEGNYSILSINGSQNEQIFEELSPAELMEKIYFTIDYLQYKRLKS